MTLACLSELAESVRHLVAPGVGDLAEDKMVQCSAGICMIRDEDRLGVNLLESRARFFADQSIHFPDRIPD